MQDAFTPLRLTNSGTSDNFQLRTKDGIYITYDASYHATGAAYANYFTNGTWWIEETTPGGSNLTVRPGWKPNLHLSDFDLTANAVSWYDRHADEWDCLGLQAAASGSGTDASPSYRSGAGGANMGLYSVVTVAAEAGSDRTDCAASTLTLSADPLPLPFAGQWTVTSGPGTLTFADDTDAATDISSYTAPGRYVLRWTNQGLSSSCNLIYDEISVWVSGTASAVAGEWAGAYDSDWHQCLNWADGQVPTTTTDVLVDDADNHSFQPVISAAAVCRDLTLENGKSLTLSGAGSLETYGHFDIQSGATFTQAGSGYLGLRQDLTINGSFSQDINTETRWIGTDHGTLAGSGTLSLHNARLQKDALSQTVTLARSLIVANQLEIVTGKLISSSTNLLIFPDTATTSGANRNGFVEGPVRKHTSSLTPFNFPTGKGSWLGLATIQATTADPTTYTAEYVNNRYPGTLGVRIDQNPTPGNLEHVSQIEYWTIDRSTTGTPADAYLSLHWGPQSGVSSDPGDWEDLRVAHFNSGISLWENTGTNGVAVGTVDSGVVYSGLIADFSPFTLSSIIPDNPLPIQQLDLQATDLGRDVRLDWQVSKEQGLAGYVPQYRAEQGDWHNLPEQRARNQGSGAYSSLHPNAPMDQLYYRLRLLDLDGAESYSQVVSLRREIADNDQLCKLGLHPNPGTEGFNVVACLSGAYEIVVYDLAGRQLMRQRGEGKGSINHPIEMQRLAEGTYLVRLIQPQQVQQLRWVKR
jgi:hypothetical protein